MALPRISSNALAGLTEALVAPPYNGRADLPVLANGLQIEADQLLLLAEMLQLLRFAELAEGDVKLTDAGRGFAGPSVDDRKALFRQHLISHMPIIAYIRHVLDERPMHRAPASRFQDEPEDYMDEDSAKSSQSVLRERKRKIPPPQLSCVQVGRCPSAFSHAHRPSRRFAIHKADNQAGREQREET